MEDRRRPLKAVRWADRAIGNLRAIEDYIAVDNPTAASRLVSGVLERVEALREFPESGRRVPELPGHSAREILFRNYRIMYQVVEDRIYVLNVIEGHRLLRAEDLPDA